MSEREKKVLDDLAALPQPLRDRFVDKIEGAAMALELLEERKEADDGKDQG